MQEYSLHVEYVKDKSIWKAYQIIKSLPFVPIEDVVKAFELIQKVSLSIVKLVLIIY